jgi:BASS family bile acid:Na+ symporter
MEFIDQIDLHFSETSLDIMNLTLAFIMFGVALDLRLEDFRRLLKMPKFILVGLTSQLILLPLFTVVLVNIIQPHPSIALGMFMIAVCPGGNVSNFMSSLAGGNVALSVSMTAVVTVSSIILTPLNFTLWAGTYAPAAEILQTIELDFWSMAQTVFLILGIPTICGMLFAEHYPEMTEKIKNPLKKLSIVIFGAYVAMAFISNFDNFLKFVKYVIVPVGVHNISALILGFYFAKLMGLKTKERRTVAIETGIQNSGLALILIFNFFDGLGGMALVAGWWSIQHLTSGTLLAFFWSKRPVVE